MSVKKISGGPSRSKIVKQASLSDNAPKNANECNTIATYEMNLSPIVDKKSYDSFIKTISMHIYREFDNNMRNEGIERPEIMLVGFDMKKSVSERDIRMANYVAINSRLIIERAFVDMQDYALKYMPRVMREMSQSECGPDKLAEFVESKVQKDIMMEIRAIAMQHIPDDERYSYVSKLKEL